MKQKFIWAAVLSMAVLMTGCGPETESPSSVTETTATTAPTEATTEETAEETTEAATEATTEAATEAATESADSGTAEGDELAQVKAAIDGYIKAIKEEDYAGIVKYYDIELAQYMETGIRYTEDELIAELKEQVKTGELAVGDMGATVGEPECHNEDAQKYNDFLASDMMKSTENDEGETIELNIPENFKIDGVYYFNYAASSSGMSVDMDLAVLRINGEWKVDSGVTLIMAFAESFS